MNRKEKWAQAFEQQMGRKPSPDEFLQASRRHFDLASLNDFAPCHPSEEEVGQPWQPQLTTLRSPEYGKQITIKQSTAFSWLNWVVLIVNLLTPLAFLILSWPWTWGIVVFLLTLLIVYLVSLVKRSRNHWLSWLILALVSISFVLSCGLMLYQGLEVANVFPDSREPSRYVQEDADFTWTTRRFKSYHFGGGQATPLKQILRERGLASQSQMVSGDLQLVYVNLADTRQTVTLKFSEQEGHFYLESGQATNLEKLPTSQTNYQSNWTSADYDALKEVRLNGKGGTPWQSVQAQHGSPTKVEIKLTSTTDGQFDQTLTAIYRDYNSPENKLSSVYLIFIWSRGGYLLQSKSSLH